MKDSPQMHDAKISEEQIRSFWDWFATIAQRLSDDFGNASLIEELDQRVSGLAQVMWEIGPGSTTENMLAISPDGDAALLPLTKRIVTQAPSVTGWEFLPARPAKPEPFRLKLRGGPGGDIEIDARPWRYLLLNGKKRRRAVPPRPRSQQLDDGK
jgi:hypothetical protein